jgi:CheY-like chemotaxis protein
MENAEGKRIIADLKQHIIRVMMKFERREKMRKRRAVIFDDEPIILKVMTYFLSSLKYEVIAFSEPMACPLYNGSAEACPKELPCADIMITDLVMPAMTGVELLRLQTAHGCKLTTKNKAVMSGHLDEEKKKQILELGCGSFEKPISLDVLASWIARCEERMDLSQPIACRRQEARRPEQRPITCTIGTGAAPVSALIINSSAGGLCLQLPETLEVGQTVRIEQETSPALRKAQVRWVRAHEKSVCLAGLQFC